MDGVLVDPFGVVNDFRKERTADEVRPDASGLAICLGLVDRGLSHVPPEPSPTRQATGRVSEGSRLAGTASNHGNNRFTYNSRAATDMVLSRRQMLA